MWVDSPRSCRTPVVQTVCPPSSSDPAAASSTESHTKQQGPVSKTASWQTLLTLDQKSDDFTRLARRLLSDQRHRKFEVSLLTEDEALTLIELTELTVGLTPCSAVHKP